MIQRIQSLFLLLAAAALLGLFGLPFASTSEPVAASALFADQKYNILDHTALSATFIAVAVVCLLSIFLFNNRKLQMRLSLLAIIGAVVGLAVAGVLFSQDTAGQTAQLGLGFGLPVVAILLTFLAYRNIQKDDKLVKSMDRLR
ncbi:MAG: DUF4293 domain-containing protein [Saprospiraceae bacterium]|nr:DUF4293 domain-containing protein [Saprospiraceae bacterium]